MSRRENIEIFKDTLEHCNTIEQLLDSIDNSISNQKVFDEKIESSAKKYDDKARVFLSKRRTFEAASKYKDKKVAVLNFASYTNPGGGVFQGSGAQEEALCRCSTLYLPLNAAEEEFYAKHRKQLADDEIDVLYGDDCIYTPDVVVFREDTHTADLLDVEDWYCVDVISAAAPNLRKDPSNIFNPNSGKKTVSISDEELLKIHINRMTQIFEIAKNEGVEVLILGALGCGAFKNPPEIVAKAFKKVVAKFLYDFKVIEFAIYVSPKGSKNYDVFRRVLKSKS